MVQGFGFRAEDLTGNLRGRDFGLRGLGLRSCFRFRPQGFRLQGLKALILERFGIWGLGCAPSV